MGSSVCDLGTIRNIIRGVDEPSPHTLLAEMIDNGEHTLSKNIFIDINTHEKTVIIGYENEANEEQLNKMVTWNPTSVIHNSGNISTCGAGQKYYAFRFRGEQTHVTKTCDSTNGKFLYKKSKFNTDIIYESAKSPDVSETQFSDVLKKNTCYVDETDEIILSLDNIFTNEDKRFPFEPKTIVVSKNIKNEKLLDWLNQNDDTNNLEKHLINKYYEEIVNNKLRIFLKFPNDKEFKALGVDCKIDIIGSTQKQNEHSTKIFYIERDFKSCKKGNYVISTNGVFFHFQKNGSSSLTTPFIITPEESENILLQFEFIQYTIKAPGDDIKNYIVGKSLEDYCGVYLKIGHKFIDGKPISCNLTKRNLQGAKLYRGILDLKNPDKTKMMLGIHGLKSDFNLGQMQSLEIIVKQCTNIYKKFCAYNTGQKSFTEINPKDYCVVNSSNKKSERTNKPGNLYLRVVGENFYKLGMTTKTNRKVRIFEKPTSTKIEELKQDFPEEEIYPVEKHYYEFLSYDFNTCSSTEQMLKEYIIELPDIITYDNKVGGDIREYFHCDDKNTIEDIKQMLIDCLV